MVGCSKTDQAITREQEELAVYREFIQIPLEYRFRMSPGWSRSAQPLWRYSLDAGNGVDRVSR